MGINFTKKQLSILWKVAVIFIFLGFNLNRTTAAVTVTVPSLNISECSYPTSYNLLGNIVITENNRADISTGAGVTLILTAPANFEFLPDPGSGVAVTTTGSDLAAATVSVATTTITITLNVNNTNNKNTLTISGVQIRALAASGAVNVTRTGGTVTINGDANGKVHATLSATTLASAVTVTAAASGSNLCVGSAAAIGSISISETVCETDFGAGAGRTFILTAPANFNFVAGVGSVTFTAGRDITSATIAVTTTTITVTMTIGGISQFDFLSITGIQVTALAPGAAGNILRAAAAAGGTAVINGDAAGGGINHGTLTSIVSAVTVNAATGGNCLTINGAWTTLGPISVTEQCPGDIAAGSPRTFTINAPANYQFNVGALPTCTFTAGRNISGPIVTMTASVITVTMNITGANLSDVFTISGIQARATAAVAANNLTSGGTAVIAGCPVGTLVGPVAGSAGAGTVTWLGGTTAWATAANWSGGVVPGVCSDVVIPVVGSTLYPILGGATTVNSITINSGATFTANAALTVNSSFTNSGTYNHNNATNAATTIFAGTEFFSAASTIVLTNWYDANVPLAKYITGNLGNVTFSTNLAVWDQDGEFSTHLVKGTLTVTKGQINMDDGTGGSILLTLNDVVTNGTGSIIFRQGATPAGGTFTLRTGNFTHNGNAFTAIMLACPGDLNWQVTGNVVVSRDFSAAQGSAGQAINVTATISGNMDINGGQFDMNEVAYLASNTTLTVGGTTTFNLTNAYTGYVTFLDGGTGNLNFTTGNWSILRAQTSYYISLMRSQAKGNPAPTGSVNVHVTNDMSMTGAQVAIVYLLYNTANTSSCTLDIDHDLNYSNTGTTGGFFPTVSNLFIANHNGALTVDIAHDLNLTNGTPGYYNVIGQNYANHNTATVTTYTIGNDFLINEPVNGDVAMIGTLGNEDLNFTVNRNFNLTKGVFYGINIGDGDFKLTTNGAFNIGQQGIFRGIYNTSDYLAGSVIFNFNSVNYDGGGFVGMYGCNPTAGEKSVFNVTNNCDIFFDQNGLATQFWIVGLGTLGATNNSNGLTLTVGGNMLVSGDPSNTFASCNAAGSETVTITGNLAITGGEVDFNVGQNSGLTTGHAVTMTIGGTLSVAANTGAAPYIGSATYLSGETGTLTATIGSMDISGTAANDQLIIKGEQGPATINILDDFTQTGGTLFFYENTLASAAGASTDIVAVTVNSDGNATGDFTQIGGVINFTDNTTATAVNTLTIKSPNYTIGGTATMTRANAGTGAVFGELYFARGGTTVFNRSSSTHQIDQIRQIISAGCTLDANTSINDFQLACNSSAGVTAIPPTIDMMDINGVLTAGTKLIFGRSESATQRPTSISVSSGGELQTANTAGMYDGSVNATFVNLTRNSANTNNAINSFNWLLNANSTITYNGTGNQVVTGKFPTSYAVATNSDVVIGTAAQYHYGKLNINNLGTLGTNFAYPAVPGAGTGNVFVRTTLLLTRGELNLAGSGTGQTITIENGAVSAITRDGATTNGYIKSEEINGGNNRAIVLWNMGAVTGAHVYPFGVTTGAANYIPFTFNKTTAGVSNISVSTRATAASNNLPFPLASNGGAMVAVSNMNDATLGGGNGAVPAVIDRFWDIFASAAATADVTFSYRGVENTLSAPYNVGNLGAQHWNGTFWDNSVGSAAAVSGATVGSVTAAGRSTFSPWVLSSTAAPLPIELLSFDANLNSDKVDLKWITATEVNNDYFTVEKSRNGQNFAEVLIVDGAGTSTTMIDYFDIDPNPFVGLSYYRLKQTDFNGHVAYSNIVPIEYNPDGNSTITVFPNPSDVGETTYLSLNQLKGQEVLVVLRDIAGREIFSKLLIINSNNEMMAIDQQGTLAKGSYLITATSANKLYNKKLIVK